MKLYIVLFLITVYAYKNAKAGSTTEQILQKLEKMISVFDNMKLDSIGLLTDELTKVLKQVSEIETKYKEKGNKLHNEMISKLTKFFNSKEYSAEESEEKIQKSGELVSSAKAQFHKCLKKPSDTTRKILKKDIESLKSMHKYITSLRKDVDACSLRKDPKSCYIDLLRNLQSLKSTIFENLIEVNQNAVQDFNNLPKALQECVDIMVAAVLYKAPELLRAVYENRMDP